jgi:hypothetical protein
LPIHSLRGVLRIDIKNRSVWGIDNHVSAAYDWFQLARDGQALNLAMIGLSSRTTLGRGFFISPSVPPDDRVFRSILGMGSPFAVTAAAFPRRPKESWKETKMSAEPLQQSVGGVALTSDERKALLALLREALGEKRVEVHHTHTPDFRTRVMGEESILRSLIEKVERCRPDTDETSANESGRSASV